MTYIEEVNDTMTKQLEEEKDNHNATVQKLATSTQLIEQLELKIKRQDEQIKKLQVMPMGEIVSNELDGSIQSWACYRSKGYCGTCLIEGCRGRYFSERNYSTKTTTSS
jgi:7-cyano-7-deazaguanine synthase in queuosine biosynthesis